jgi:dephospho-CoA kinase
MSIIAFNGLKQSGKSTCAKILSKNKEYLHLSFSDPLKEGVSKLFNLTDECYDVNKKESNIPHYNITPRKLLQVIGTDIFRDNLIKFLPNLQLSRNSIWESLLYDKVIKHRNVSNIDIIVDDLRFEDEYKCIKDLNGIVIKVVRMSEEEYNLNLLENKIMHKSEQDLKYFDHIIYNEGSVEELETKIKEILPSITP